MLESLSLKVLAACKFSGPGREPFGYLTAEALGTQRWKRREEAKFGKLFYSFSLRLCGDIPSFAFGVAALWDVI
jgi:hypothetical protein